MQYFISLFLAIPLFHSYSYPFPFGSLKVSLMVTSLDFLLLPFRSPPFLWFCSLDRHSDGLCIRYTPLHFPPVSGENNAMWSRSTPLVFGYRRPSVFGTSIPAFELWSSFGSGFPCSLPCCLPVCYFLVSCSDPTWLSCSRTSSSNRISWLPGSLTFSVPLTMRSIPL